MCTTCTENGHECLGYSTSGSQPSRRRDSHNDRASEDEKETAGSETASIYGTPRPSTSGLMQHTEFGTPQEFNGNHEGVRLFDDEHGHDTIPAESRKVP